MRVKKLDDLRAMEKSGAVKNVEGVKFVEPAAAPQAPSAPQPSIEPLVAAIKESMDRQSAMSAANTKAIYELLLRLARNPDELPVKRTLHWRFTVTRDDDGFTSSIDAKAIE